MKNDDLLKPKNVEAERYWFFAIKLVERDGISPF